MECWGARYLHMQTLTCVSCGMWRTVCSLSLWWCLDSSSYARSLSACGSVRNLLMVHRFSHRVRFSGLGFSFHRSSSHSQPWRGDKDVCVGGGKVRLKRKGDFCYCVIHSEKELLCNFLRPFSLTHVHAEQMTLHLLCLESGSGDEHDKWQLR